MSENKEKNIEQLEIAIVSESNIEKLEKIKELLAEIKQLKEEVFGKQIADQENICFSIIAFPATDFISSQEEKSEFSEMYLSSALMSIFRKAS